MRGMGARKMESQREREHFGVPCGDLSVHPAVFEMEKPEKF
jgi:hypothetical protein